MPEFSIARGRFDHYLMGYAMTKGNGPVIDLTKDWVPIHPEPRERLHGDPAILYSQGHAKLAYQIFRNSIHYQHSGLHAQIDMTKFYFRGGEIEERENTIKNEAGIIL